MIYSSYKCGAILYDWVNRGNETDYVKEMIRKQKEMAYRMGFEMILEVIPELVIQLIFNFTPNNSNCSDGNVENSNGQLWFSIILSFLLLLQDLLKIKQC